MCYWQFALIDSLIVIGLVSFLNLFRAELYRKLWGAEINHSTPVYLSNGLIGFVVGIPLGYLLAAVSNTLGGSDEMARSVILVVILSLSLVSSHFSRVSNPALLSVLTTLAAASIFMIHYTMGSERACGDYLFLWAELF
ncbi:MAG: hypothetical protein ACXAE3_12355 [Candidatus Kariarchaeaceae archaeon]|jgi:hypothetical protein